MRPWPHHAAMAAPQGLEPRGTSQWPDMLEIRDAAFSRWILTGAMLLGLAAAGTPGVGADEPGRRRRLSKARRSPIRCAFGWKASWRPSTTAPEAAIPAKDDQIRRYQDAAAKQQAELDRVTMQAKRMGCESSGFFSLFNGQSAQCGPVNNQIQQMRGNLDQITTSLERLRSGGIGGADRENQRRSVLTALAQNNCGPQYAAAARGRRRQFHRQPVRQQRQSDPAAGRRIRSAIRHLPHRLRPHLRRRLFPGLVRDRPGAFCRRREDLQGAVPGGGGDAVHLPQSRRRHQPGGLGQRPALHGAAERVQVPQRVQPVLRLQGRRARPGPMR